MVNGNLLRGRIVAAGMLQKELAAAVGMSPNSLTMKIQGRRSFSCDEVEKICDVLEITEPREKCEIFLAKPSQN